MPGRNIIHICFILTFILGGHPSEILAISGNGPTQNTVRFKYINSENGLPGETVRSIFQDNEDLIWLGLESVGLCRFDGNKYEIFSHDPNDSLSLSSDFIQDIAEDSAGNLWIATDYGLNELVMSNSNIINKKFVKYFHREGDPNSISGNLIHTITVDSRGNLWVGSNAGLDVVPKGRPGFRHIIFQDDSVNTDVNDILEDHAGKFWIASSNGLYCLDRNGNLIKYWNTVNSPLLDNQINVLCFDDDNNLWIGTMNGINILDTTNFQITQKKFEGKGANRFAYAGITCLMKDNKHRLWIGSFSYGMIIYNLLNQTYSYYCNEQNYTNGLKSNQIRDIYQDKQGMIWIAAKNTGLHILNQRLNTFEYITQKTNDLPGLSDKSVNTIFEGRNGIIWIGTKLGGLNKYNPKTNNYSYYKKIPGNPLSLGNNRVESIFEDSRGILWIATINGLDEFNPVTEVFRNYEFVPVKVIQEDKLGRLWLGTREGVYLFDKKTKKYSPARFAHETIEIKNLITSILIDSKEIIWIGTTNSGLAEYYPETDSLIWHTMDNTVPGKISSNMVRSIYEDKKGSIWVGTKLNGLNRFDKTTRQFDRVTTLDGLPSNSIFSILEDDKGSLWLATNNGISKYNPVNKHVTNFSKDYGLQGDVFILNAACKTKSGKFYFGGNNGLNSFYPDKVEKLKFSAPIIISSIKVYDKIIKEDINNFSGYTFDKNNYISFEFALLDYSSTKNTYEYKLEGLNDDWINSDRRNYVSYVNLPVGKYTFYVRGYNIDHVRSASTAYINFRILPPWYATKLAYFFYIMLSFLIIYGFYRLVKYRTFKQNEVELLKLEKDQVEKLNQLKLRFFTNISHEIRTPLSLIVTPVEKIAEQKNLPKDIKTSIELIRRNTRRLINLVDELLEFRKIEQGQMALKLKKGDLIKFLRDIIQPYSIYIESRKIIFNFTSNISECITLFDPGAIEKIMSNLLSNAVKYTYDNGVIEVFVNEKTVVKQNGYIKGFTKTGNIGDKFVEISVKDNGRGIHQKELENIFQRFYRPEQDSADINGVGIGLDLTKNLVELHHGSITVESTYGYGSTFTFILPLEEYYYSGDNVSKSPLTTEKHLIKAPDIKSDNPATIYNTPVSENNKQNPLILVVDDDTELLSLYFDILSDLYSVIASTNATEALKIANEKIPDLIISDIMMPGMNGNELCSILKSTYQTSHIPVILLTAKVSIDDCIEGLEKGADLYIAKPFHPKRLKLEIANIIRSRQLMWEKIKKDFILEPKTLNIPSAEEKFLTRCVEITENNMSEPAFSVLELGRELGLGRTQLFRKMKALTGQSPVEFIYSLRLKRAAALLSEKKYTVAETAYMTGFSNPSSFSTSFRNYFGINPSNYLNKAIGLKK